MIARGQSQINLRGGGFGPFDHDETAELFDSSLLRVFGQYEDLDVTAHDSAKLELTENSSISGVRADGTSHIRVERSLINNVHTEDHAIARLIDAEGVYERVDVTAAGHSEIKITRGRLESVGARDYGVIWLDGGGLLPYAIDQAAFHWVRGTRFVEPFFVSDDAALHVYGYDMEYSVYDDGELPAVHGNRKDGTFFYTPVILSGNGRIVFHTVPEPRSFMLLGVGLLAMIRARRLSRRVDAAMTWPLRRHRIDPIDERL